MKRTIVMLVMIVIGTATAHADDAIVRGLGSSSCHEIMETLPDNQSGNGILMTYASGFLSGINGMAWHGLVEDFHR